MDRVRLRGWLVVGTLVAAGVASCGRDSPVGVGRSLETDPSRAVSWDPDPYLCRIGKYNLDPGGSQTWFGTAVPTVDTTCGVIVTMTIPPFIDLARYPNERLFYWKYLEPGAPKTSGYQIGFYNDHVNGPITYTFSQGINKFSMQVQNDIVHYATAPIAAGHYMLAFDATSGGNKLDSVSFGPGVGSPIATDVRALLAFGIRRVEVHMQLIGPEPTGDYAIAQPLIRWAALSQDTTKPPCPPVPDPVLDSQMVRDTIIGVYNATKNDSAELVTLVYKNPFRIVTPIQNRSLCDLTFTWPTAQAHLDPDLVATIHAHAIGYGQPDPCNDNLPYDVRSPNGLSKKDLGSYVAAAIGRNSAGLPTIGYYVIDDDVIWLNPPGSMGANFGRNKSAPRVPPNCKWR